MGQQHDFYLVQTGNLVPRSASWRGFLACFQQPNPLRSANLDSSGKDYVVLRGDSRELLGSIDEADLAVFSPPYPNSFDYT